MTAVADAAVAERVRGLVHAMAPDPYVRATDDQRLIEDLGFESLRLMELTVVLERAFDLPRHRPERLVGVRRVGDVIALVTAGLAAGSAEEHAPRVSKDSSRLLGHVGAERQHDDGMGRRDTVLVTGASGLVGAEVVARLAAASYPVAAVLHNNARIVRNDGTALGAGSPVAGDIRMPGFGLSPRDSADLSERVGTIVHCAATTAFDADPLDYHQLNVRGTANAVALAKAWDVQLVYVSTAYVCGRRGGVITEDELDAGQSFGNRYEESKFHAEHLVRAAGGHGLRWSIVRPGIVTGARGSGVIREYKNLYTVVKLMVEGKLRSLPGRYDATLALAPVDYVAEVIAAAVLDFDSAHQRTFHAVGRDALSLREVSDVLAEYPSFEVATFVPEATFDENDLAGVEREYYRRIGSLYTSYFDRRVAFDTANAEVLLGKPAPSTGKEYLRVLLDYCLESGYLGVPLPSIEEVLAHNDSGGALR
ncbi:thioester reductase-like protein [Nocardia tenerifensis]|uniref:Thioester reductase-like protein n=1 Tax=Nocardia tenerifensis TaxID=228006 RepID=A0A318JYX1_9NOCA|nr:SDR family oxidoreductase [Nocardia tenerifensis]PXX60182.1 thioester reductase-like protein [Nocardia tenerifensis]